MSGLEEALLNLGKPRIQHCVTSIYASCSLVVRCLVQTFHLYIISRTTSFSFPFAYDLISMLYTFIFKYNACQVFRGKCMMFLTFTFTPKTMWKRFSSHCSFVCGLCSPKLAPFIEYLLSLTRAIEKRREGGASSDDTTALARRIKRLLVEVNEYDRARRLSKLFQLKEAL